MSTFSGPEIVNSGLVLNLDAANPRSYPGTGTTWYNLTKYNLNGNILNGCAFSDGAFTFDGVDDYINLGSPADLNFITGETTIAWYYPTNLSGASGERRSRIGNRQNGFLTLHNDTFGYEGINSDGNWNNNTYSGSVVEVNKWQQLCFTFKGADNISLYKNGVYVTGKAITTNQVNTGGSFVIGTEAFGGWGTFPYYTGKISLVLNYNRALTAAEVKQNFEAIRGRFGI